MKWDPNPMKLAEVTQDLVATAFLAELLAKISSVR